MSGAMKSLTLRKQEALQKSKMILEKAKTEERVLSVEEKTELEGLEAELERVNGLIEQQTRLEALDAQILRDVAEGRRSTQEASDPSTQDFRSLGEFLQAVAYWAMPGKPKDPRLVKMKAIASGMNEAVGSEGGFLVMKDFTLELLARAFKASILAPRCTRIPIGPNSDGLVAPYIEETTRVTGSRWGGVQVYWAAEATAPTAKQPKIGKFSLDLEKLIGLSRATNELLRDASALGAILSQAFQEEFGWMLDDAILAGTGAGVPLGILNSAALVSIAKETNQAAATVVAQNVIKMRARMPARFRPNSLWLIHEADVEVQLQQMSLPVGTGGINVYLPANGLSQDGFDSLYGRPVVPMEQCLALGTKGDILYFDPTQYVLIDKDSILADQSMHVYFTTDEMAFRWIYRVNGAPKFKTSVTTAKGSLTVSPYISLDTRA